MSILSLFVPICVQRVSEWVYVCVWERESLTWDVGRKEADDSALSTEKDSELVQKNCRN
jgi:hypothetical protein